MKVVSLNVGLPQTQRYGLEEVRTGGAKKPVPEAMLRTPGFDGDGQADRINHGGVDKAVCVYPEHLANLPEFGGRALFAERLRRIREMSPQ